MRLAYILAAACFGALAGARTVEAQDCSGQVRSGIGRNSQAGLFLADGSVAMRARMNINIDGSGRAYHPNNAAAGALIHLCNAGEVHLPDGTRYHGSESNATCTGRFMSDFQRIRAAGWTNPAVGVIRWYGILGTGAATIAGRRVTGIVPVELSDGSGFYVSPTALRRSPRPGEPSPNPLAQDTYVDPLLIPAAVVPLARALQQSGVTMGSFGVAVHIGRGQAVPFVVGDVGPRVGEGSVALARLVSGFPVPAPITRSNRFQGQLDRPDVLWIFFGRGEPAAPYDPDRVLQLARSAFENWGGEARLRACLSNPEVPVN